MPKTHVPIHRTYHGGCWSTKATIQGNNSNDIGPLWTDCSSMVEIGQLDSDSGLLPEPKLTEQRWVLGKFTWVARWHHWSLRMDKNFYSTLSWACNYLSMLGSKLILVSKRGHWRNLTENCTATMILDFRFRFGCGHTTVWRKYVTNKQF